MKRLLLCFCLLFIITGCSKDTSVNIIKKFSNKVNSCNSYYLSGDLELRNNDEVYNYEVEVSYEKDSKYKVLLKNKANKATQIILKNSDGVYILTPSLNRSFKFQSDWPYNNSQIYLLKALIDDIKNSFIKFNEKSNYYVIETKVNYPNNTNLVKQKIYIDKKILLKKVEVYDSDDIESMKLEVKKLDYSPSFKDDYFDLNTIMSSSEKNNNEEVSSIEEAIYPLLIPTGTSLSNEERIKKTKGERVLMTFDGDKPFLLVEETVDINDELTIIPTNGEPYQLMDTLGVMTNNSLSWVSNGIEYYLVSDVLSISELTQIAQSIYVLPTMK